MSASFLVQAHTGRGWDAWVTRNAQGIPQFTFNAPRSQSRDDATQLLRDARRLCGGTLRLVAA